MSKLVFTLSQKWEAKEVAENSSLDATAIAERGGVSVMDTIIHRVAKLLPSSPTYDQSSHTFINFSEQ